MHINLLPKEDCNGMESTLDAGLKGVDRKKIYSRFSPDETIDVLQDVSVIYSDLDGTTLLSGETRFAEDTLKYLRFMQKAGIKVIFITGKPWTEVEKLITNTPSNIDLKIMFEKGAYLAESNNAGEVVLNNFIVTPEMQHDIDALKKKMPLITRAIEQQYPVKIVPAGDGGHLSVVSIDIIKREYADNYKQFRRLAKVSDKVLLEDIKETITALIAVYCKSKNFELVDIGNGNFEIGNGSLNKKDAVLRMEMNHENLDGNRLLLDDSGNGKAMFDLKNKASNFFAAVVKHDQTPKALVEQADLYVEGEGRAVKIFQSIMEAKGVSTGLNVIATNTGPSKVKSKLSMEEKLHVSAGMPIAIAELFKDFEGAWVYVGKDNFNDIEENPLQGKLFPVDVSKEEKEDHYARISNGVLWPAMHKSETGAAVESYEENVWQNYDEVCRKIAEKVNERIEAQEQVIPGEKATVWVQDYQMLGVANYLREIRRKEDYNLGLYWHIPLPKADVLEEHLGLDKTIQLVSWLSDYHLIGFHTQSYAGNYIDACNRYGISPAEVLVKPISVGVEDIQKTVREQIENGYYFEPDDECNEDLNALFEIEKIRDGIKRDTEIILCGMERCDYTKATLERLRAWKNLAKKNPGIFKDKKIVEVIVPSRQAIGIYAEMYKEAINLITEINDIVGRKVIHHVQKINSRHNVITAMALSDMMIINPNNDGYNMAAAEYAVVMKEKEAGKLLVSPRAGFYMSLREAGIEKAVNAIAIPEGMPMNEEVLSNSITEFFGIPEDPESINLLARYFETNTISSWVAADMQRIVRNGLKRDIDCIECN
jgi:trehalose-6-phosphate synthase/hydroxymethylpyrimidine pyrophosphatase-like HAD family hydrolase